MVTRILAGTLVLCLCAGTAGAATPTFGTRDGDLGCAGLLAIAYEGAKAADSSKEQVLAAAISAYGVYVGRLSKASPPPTKQAIGVVIDKMSADDRNNYGRICLTRAGELLRAPFIDDQPPAPTRPGR